MQVSGEKNPKQCSFLCLIYVNHGSFHKRNKRHCERLVLPWPCPPPALPPDPSFTFDSFCQDRREHAHGHCFFFLLPPSDNFPFNCQDTVHTLPQTASQVMPAAHRHILLQSTLCAAQHTRDGGKGKGREGERERRGEKERKCLACFREEKKKSCGARQKSIQRGLLSRTKKKKLCIEANM